MQVPALVDVIADLGRGAPGQLDFSHAIGADGFDCLIGRLGKDDIVRKQAVDQFIGSIFFAGRIGVCDLLTEFTFVIGFDLISEFNKCGELGNIVMVGQQVVDNELTVPFRFGQIPPGIDTRAIRQQLVIVEPLRQFPVKREAGA